MHAKAERAYFAANCSGRRSGATSATARRSRTLPVTRKSDLIDLQKRDAAVRGHDRACRHGALGRVFSSPGPIYDPQGAAQRFLAHGRARCSPRASARGDLVHNTFSYHFTPAGS